MPARPLFLGKAKDLTADDSAMVPIEIPAHHLVTHSVIVGMTGSGKTGLAMVMVEEALRSKIPVLMVDIKGDLPNLFLAPVDLQAQGFERWIDSEAAVRDGKTIAQAAEEVSTQWREGLARWSLGAEQLRAMRESIQPRIFTPGATIAEPIHLLSALEVPSDLWESDEDAARDALSSAVSLLLQLMKRDSDPTQSREHVVLSQLAERRLRARQPATLELLLADLARPPIERIGAMSFAEFLPEKERLSLSQQINTLLASSTFSTWRQGAALNVSQWFTRPRDGKTPAVILSVAHLDDSERLLVLGLLFDSILHWVRSLSGTSELRALVVFDEVYGFLPPHPANPPTKKPLLGLLKQARAFGVGMVLATQNPMDLDYKALSNAGLWMVGRLQTDADRERVVEGLAGSDSGAGGLDAPSLEMALKSLPKRRFFVRDVHRTPQCGLLDSRWSLSWLRGPITRAELRQLAKPYVQSSPGMALNTPVANGATDAPASAPLTPSTRAEVSGLSSVPSSPPAWKTWHGAGDSAPVSRWQYVPWVAVKAVAHLRDAKLNLETVHSSVIAAPLTEDGRVDTTKAIEVDPKFLENPPVQGARYKPLSEQLSKAITLKSLEKSLREHATRTLALERWVHAELRMVQSDGESQAAFAARCREASTSFAQVSRGEIERDHAPKIQRLTEKCHIARRELATAESSLSSAPSDLSAIVMGAINKKAGSRALSQKDKAQAKVEKFRVAVQEAEAAVREAVAKRDAEISATVDQAQRAAEGIELRVVTPKKGDVEILEIGIAWARG